MNNEINNTVIELTAATALKGVILRTGLVEPEIKENDKTPSWDGEIRLYSSRKSFSKENLRGRIPVQVKGTCVERFDKRKVTYQADIDDLENYLSDGGVMFFLIQLKDFDNYKIYYASLLPFDLRRIIEAAGGQKSKKILLEPFPNRHIDGMCNIFAAFLENKKKQAQLLPNIRSIQDLQQSKIEIDRLEISIPADGKSQDDAFSYLLENPQYVYMKPKNLEALFVVDKINIEQITFRRDTPIKVNGEVLFDNVEIIHSTSKEKTFKIGSGILCTLGDSSIKFDYSFTGSLHEQLCQMKLMRALAEGREVLLGNLALPNSKFELNGHTQEELYDRLSWLESIAATLKQLHVKKDLELGSLTKQDIENLKWLVDGILNGNAVSYQMSTDVCFGTLSIGELSIFLSVKKNPSGNGVYITDFFSLKDLSLTPPDVPPEQGIPSSPYLLLDAKLLGTLDNIDFDNIANSITSYPYSDLYGMKTTWFILEMLKYYDSCENKNNVILDTVLSLNEYLLKNDPEQRDLYEINKIQTIKRKRPLTKGEIKYLVSLKADGIPTQYQLAANILLGSFDEAQIKYDELSEIERTQFDDYPIMMFWNTEKK